MNLSNSNWEEDATKNTHDDEDDSIPYHYEISQDKVDNLLAEAVMC